MWVNLGSGDHYVLGWHNVDHDGCPHPVDEHVDITQPLPWEPGSLTRVYAGHVLEHLSIPDAAKLLARLHDLAAPGCDLMVVGPDVHRAEQMRADGLLSAEWLRLVREGGCRWPGDEHLWLCKPGTLGAMVREAGWQMVHELDILDVPDVWPVVAFDDWQCAVSAVA